MERQTNGVSKSGAAERLLAGELQWRGSGPIISSVSPPGETRYSIKDPSVVWYQGRWHVFCTVLGKERPQAVEYLSFADWNSAHGAGRQVLNSISQGAFDAPQVFYFTPQSKWYLIYQGPDPAYQSDQCPTFSTTGNLEEADSWSKGTAMYRRRAECKAGLDYWVICDQAKAHLFYTSMDGNLWRRETKLSDFPLGWSEPEVMVYGDILEASHTYALKGLNKYLTIVEAATERQGNWRYLKAYIADRLEGPWKSLAHTLEKPFAGMANVQFQGERWTDSISHGELLRIGYDEKMEVDPGDMKLLFQGVANANRTEMDRRVPLTERVKLYRLIPWQLGILEMTI